LIDDERGLVSIEVKPSFKALGPRYGKHMKAIAAHLAAADPAAVRTAVERGGYSFEIDGTRIELGEADVDVRLSAPEHLVVAVDGGSFAALDTTITPALEREGIARDFNRHAQDRRKAMDLNVSDRVRVRFSASDAIAQALQEHRSFLANELLAETIERSDSARDVVVKIGGEEVGLALERA
jgi:isoleucyl-tRNA synthetase